MPPIDKLLSQYSAPVRSWPGEEDLDAEARANYEAANPPKLQTEGGSIDKGDLLPIVRYPVEKPNPSDWQSSSDVMKRLDDGWKLEPFSRLSAPFQSMAEAWRTQPVLGPMVRPSQMRPDVFNQMSSDAMTVAGTGMTGGLGRAAVAQRAPSGTFDLGMFGGRRGAEELARKGEPRPLQALNMLEQMEQAGASREEIWTATGDILKDTPYIAAFRGVDQKPRFEIDDSGASLGSGSTIGEALHHDPLSAAYPQTGSYEFNVAPLGRGQHGAFQSGDTPSGIPPSITVSKEGPHGLSSALHEMQHGVDVTQEGFATGANQFGMSPAAVEIYRGIRKKMSTPLTLDEWAKSQFDGDVDAARASYQDYLKTAGKITPQLDRIAQETAVEQAYRRSAGEVGARTVQARQDLTPEQRRARAPWLDYDVPEKDQIVRFGNESGAMSSKPLDMSPEARLARARDMGFDVDRPLYHGTTAKFDSFADKPAFFTEERGVAAAYARPYSGPRGEVGEYYIRPGKQANLLDPEMRAEIIDDIAVDVGASPRQIDEALRYGSIYNYLDDGAEARFFEALKSRGFDSVRMPDAHPGTGAVVESVVALNPNNIRSVDAAFDPSEFASPTLMASIDPLTAAVSPPRQIDLLGYYSPTLDAALRLSQKKGTPEQMLAQLKKAGAKDSEIEVSGLKKMFEGKKSVSQEEIVKALEEGKVGLNEQVYDRGNAKLRYETDPDEPHLTAVYRPDRSGDVMEAEIVDAGRYVEVNGAGRPQRFRTMDEARAFVESNAGLGDATKYSHYSLDPENPTYREVVLHLPDATADLAEKIRGMYAEAERLNAAGYRDEADRLHAEATGLDEATPAPFESGHFPEPNIVGHMMVSETRLPDSVVFGSGARERVGTQIARATGARSLDDITKAHIEQAIASGAVPQNEALYFAQKQGIRGLPAAESPRVLTLDQVQSDWGQRLRDGGVRDEAKIADLRGKLAATDAEAKAMRKELYDSAERAGFKVDSFGLEDFVRSGTPEGEAAKALRDRYFEVQSQRNLWDAELRTAEAATPGHPLVNTTDQWLNTTLRRAIRMASEEGQDYIAIPSGRTVLGYNPGQEKGMLGFYGGMPEEMGNVMASLKQAATKAPNEPVINVLNPKTIDALAQAGILDKKKIEGISAARVLKNAEARFQGIVPKNLYALLQKLDKATPPPQVIDTLDSPSGRTGLGEGFTLFKITPEAKKAAKESGQPLFRFGGRVTR